MANTWMHYTCYFIVFTICVDQGDGRWKKKERENLQHDIDTFKRMAEKIEHKIEMFYEDYIEEKIKEDNLIKLNRNHVENLTNLKEYTNNKYKNLKESLLNSSHSVLNKTKTYIHSDPVKAYLPNELKFLTHVVPRHKVSNFANKPINSKLSWPKFEDILLAMGKRYDWKNDRWIKVKRKLKESRTKKVKEVDKSINFHEIHKFSYRTVKLNKSKSRRNVVIAVSAVR